MKNIHAELDIHHILYKLQEIEKLKTLLLNKNQIILFNFTPKPLIRIQDTQVVLNRLQFDENPSLMVGSVQEAQQTLIEAYKHLVEESQVECVSEMVQVLSNQKILNLLGNELQSQDIRRQSLYSYSVNYSIHRNQKLAQSIEIK